MPAITRIDGTDASHQLRQALAEHTGGKISDFAMNRVEALEGGIKKRQLTATIDGERKGFWAVEQHGKVGFYDSKFDLQPNQIHQFLTKLESSQISSSVQRGWPERVSSASSTAQARIRRH